MPRRHMAGQYVTVATSDETDESATGALIIAGLLQAPAVDKALAGSRARQTCTARPCAPPRDVLYLGLCCMLNAGVYFQFHAVPSTATLLRLEFGLSATEIGTLQSMYSLPTIFVIFLSGILVDSIGLWSSCLVFTNSLWVLPM